MRPRSAVAVVVAVCICMLGILSRNARAGDASAPQRAAAAPDVHLFDTGVALAAPLPGEAFARTDRWTEVGKAEADHRFAGDAVIVNNKLAVVLRVSGPGLEVYSMGGTGPRMRSVLAPDSPGPLAGLSAVKVTSVSPSAVALEATYHVAGGGYVALGLEMKMGEPQVNPNLGILVRSF